MSVAKIAIIALLATLGAFAVFRLTSHKNGQDTAAGEFDEWKAKYNKNYGGAEHHYRLTVFTENKRFVEHKNAQKLSYTLELNEFADLTSEEFRTLYTGLKGYKTSGVQVDKLQTVSEPPASIDWRSSKTPAVNKIKDQAQCGSCWAFSAVGAIEGAVALKTGKLPNLSEQDLVDCSSSYGNQGCNGGLMDDAFKFVIAKGIETQADYPYTARDGKCKHDPKKATIKITNYKDVPANDYKSLKAAVAQQPIAVAIDAGLLQLYRGGIIDAGCGTDLDHGVLAVGYNDKGAWIVRNSWGASWGEKGYFQVKIGDQNRGAGACGINSMASYPVV